MDSVRNKTGGTRRSGTDGGKARIIPRLTPERSEERGSRLIGRPKGTGSQRIYDIIRKRILSLEMPPGSGIDENALASEFGVSRTPVREALIRLATDGFVTLLPNRGASVSPLDIDEIPELLAAVDLCLRVTSRWAAVRHTQSDLAAMRAHQRTWIAASHEDDFLLMNEANSELHLAIAVAAGNRHLTALYKGILPQYHRLTVSLLSSARDWSPDYKRYFADLNDEHERLITAIADRDSELADRLAQEHARLVGERLEAFMMSAFSNSIRIDDPKGLPRRRGAAAARG